MKFDNILECEITIAMRIALTYIKPFVIYIFTYNKSYVVRVTSANERASASYCRYRQRGSRCFLVGRQRGVNVSLWVGNDRASALWWIYLYVAKMNLLMHLLEEQWLVSQLRRWRQACIGEYCACKSSLASLTLSGDQANEMQSFL